MMIKKLTFLISSALLLTACGGSSSKVNQNNDSNNATSTPPTLPLDGSPSNTTVHTLEFPIAEYKIKAVDVGLKDHIFSLIENYKTTLNNKINENTQTLYQQNIQYDPAWQFRKEYVLTKNKIYYSANSQHPQYLVSNSNGKIITTFDSETPQFKSTLTFKNISLNNSPLNSAYVTTELLKNPGESLKNDKNWLNLSNQIKNISGSFPKDSVCHQYLTQQYNQPNISFSEFDDFTNKTIAEWIAEQKASDNNPIVETWASYQVAYIPESQQYNFYHGEGYRGKAVILKNGKLYEGNYDAGAVYELKDEYDNPTQFNLGICNAYNKIASDTLKIALLGLVKN